MDTQYEATCKALAIKPNSRVRKDLAHNAYQTSPTINLSGNFLGPSGLQAFLSVVGECRSTKELSLRNNGLDNDSVVALCRVLAAHPTMTSVDLSENPLTLVAAYALMDLVRKNPTIKTLILEKTDIEDSVLQKILNLHAAVQAATAKTTTPSNGGPTPYSTAVAAAKRKKKKATANSKVETTEAALRALARDRFASMPFQRASPSDWIIIPLLVLSTKYDFASELSLVHTQLIPSLNERLRQRKAFVHPISMYYDPDRPGNDLDMRSPKPGNLYSHLYLLKTYRPLCVAFVGDTHGWVPTLGLDAPWMSSDDTARQLRHAPIIRWEIEMYLKNKTGVVPIVMQRGVSTGLKIPESVMECMTDDFTRIHPDPMPSTLKVIRDPTLATAGVHEERVRTWGSYVTAREGLLAAIPPSTIVHDYQATFSHVDAKTGIVSLGGLDAMQRDLDAKLWAILDEVVPPAPSGDHDPWFALNLHAAVRQTYLSQIPTLVGQKSTLGKLDLYTATPSSRNMYLLATPPGSGASSVLAAYINKISKRVTCLHAAHLTSRAALTDERCDLRTVLLSLCKQMLPDRTLPTHIQVEIRISEIKKYFKETLTQIAKGLPEGNVLVIVVEDLDDISPAVLPSPSLSQAETGAEGLKDPVAAEEPISTDPFDWIPMCLARNVRIVGTVCLNSPTHIKLAARGHDSCEVLIPSPIGDADVDVIASKLVAAKGVEFSESEMVVIRSKEASRQPQYLALLAELVLQRYETATYDRRETFLKELPSSLQGLCGVLADGIEAECGVAITRRALSLLVVASEYNGLLEMQWRDMLGELCGETYVTLLRRLSPVVCPFLTDPLASLNGTACVVQLSCHTFSQVIRDRYMPTPKDTQIVHQLFVSYYKRLVENPSHPLHPSAVLHLPRHMIAAGQWNTFLSYVCSLAYIQLSFESSFGYCLYRDTIHCYNQLESRGKTVGMPPATADAETTLFKLKEYITFINHNLGNLATHPRMCCQLALLVSAVNGSVYREARDHFKEATTRAPYFTFVNKGRVRLHKDVVNRVAFAPNGLSFATCGKDRTIRICNVRGDTTNVVSQTLSAVHDLVYSATNKYLIAACEDRFVASIDVSEGKLITRMTGHLGKIVSVRVSARGRYTVTGGDDRAMCVWDSESGKCLTLQPHNQFSSTQSGTGAVSAVRCHPMDESVFLSACDRTVIMWKLKPTSDALSAVHSMICNTALPVVETMFLRDGAFVLTVCGAAASVAVPPVVPLNDHPVKIWQNGEYAAHLVVPQEMATDICAVRVSANESIVVLGTTTGYALLYRMTWATLLRDKAVHPTFVIRAHKTHGKRSGHMMIVASPNSAMVATVGSDKMVQVFNTVTGESMAQFVAESSLTTVDWTPIPSSDGGDIIVGDVTGRVYVLKLNNVPTDLSRQNSEMGGE